MSKNLVATVVNYHTFTVDSRYIFPIHKILGLGSYGVVAAAFDTVRKVDVAIKRVSKNFSSNILRFCLISTTQGSAIC